MGLIRGVSALVIRCFRRVEHCADAVTGAAGPVFIALAWTLTLAGGFVFFDVVASSLGFWATLFMLPLYILVPLNMYGQYYLVTHVSPGYPVQRSPKDTRLLHPSPRSLLSPERWGWERRGPQPPPPGPAPGARVRRCRKCDGPKPERAHHCSVCKRCVLQMDHHCPWINTCVGLHNQRHFVLFMTWLTIGCWIVLFLGWPYFWYSIDVFNYEWKARSPAIIFTLVWVLSIAIGFAVPVLGLWHMYMVSRGETSIEGHDNEYLEKKAKAEGLIYLNPYDLGRRRNLELFFNVGPDGYPLATLLFPLLVPPAVNGWVWPQRRFPMDTGESAARVAPELHAPELAAGFVAPKEAEHSGSARHTTESLVGDGPGGRYIMGGGDDLTDDEGGGGGWWDEPGNDGN